MVVEEIIQNIQYCQDWFVIACNSNEEIAGVRPIGATL